MEHFIEKARIIRKIGGAAIVVTSNELGQAADRDRKDFIEAKSTIKNCAQVAESMEESQTFYSLVEEKSLYEKPCTVLFSIMRYIMYGHKHCKCRMPSCGE